MAIWLMVIKVAMAVSALLGSSVIVADYWSDRFHNSLNKITGFNKVEKGREKLRQFEYFEDQDKNVKEMFEKAQVLRENDAGFRQILNIILKKRSEYRDRQISEIICSVGTAYRKGRGAVSQRYISLLTEGQSTDDVVATAEQVERWISEARTKRVLFLGFLLLLIGFLFSLAVSIHEVGFKVE